jgi:hypothetical protein
MKSTWRQWVFVLSLLCGFALPATSYAESCWLAVSCEGNIGWFRVNKYSTSNYVQESQALFGGTNLPLINSEITITRNANLRDIPWFQPDVVECHDIEYLRMAKAEPQCKLSVELQLFPAGTKIRVLGYQKGFHLFALVQIISYPKWGDEVHRKALNLKYLDEEI